MYTILEPKKSKPLNLIGQILGDSPGYRVGSKISEGAFGQVYEVESMSTGNKYAMKILNPTSKNISEFNRELTAYELLSSKNESKEKEPVGCYEYIVCLIDAFIQPVDDKNYYVFVLELMDNELWALVESGITTKDSDIMLFYMKTLLEGLAYIHSKGMAHNDIKPENILLKSYGDKVPIAKYTDFGLSCTDKTRPGLFGTKEIFIDALTKLEEPIFTERELLRKNVTTLKEMALEFNALNPKQYSLLQCGRQGSLEYTSPDILIAEEHSVTLELSQKDDIWALGIVFRTLAAGFYMLPFANANILLARDEVDGEEFLTTIYKDVKNNVGTIPVVYNTTKLTDTGEVLSKISFRDKTVKEVIESMSAVKAADRPSAEDLLKYIKTAEEISTIN